MVQAVHRQFTREEANLMDPYQAGRACCRSGKNLQGVGYMFEGHLNTDPKAFARGWWDESAVVLYEKATLFCADPEAYKDQLNREFDDLGIGTGRRY